MAVAGVVVTGVLATLGLLLSSNLLSSSSLGGGVDVLNLGLTKDAAGNEGSAIALLRPVIARNSHVRVAVGGLVDLGIVDDEQDLFATIRQFSSVNSCCSSGSSSPRSNNSADVRSWGGGE